MSAGAPVTANKLRWTRHSYYGLDDNSNDESKTEEYRPEDVIGGKKYIKRKSFATKF